jgi:putative FmdB family regulatory protein
MPIYEFKCKECGVEYEEIVSLKEDKNPSRPECNSSKVEKKISVFGSIGSGSGSCNTSGFS